MAKGQQRSNREKKKPKQPQKPAAIPASSRVTPVKAFAPVPDKKK
jgi:hypothetical protein